MTVGPDLHIFLPAKFLQLFQVHKMVEAAFGKSPVHILFGFYMRQIPTGNRLSDFAGLNK